MRPFLQPEPESVTDEGVKLLIGRRLESRLSQLSGIGKHLAVRTYPAEAQVATIASLKLGWGSVLLKYYPTMDSLIALVIATQLICEGIAAVLLLIAGRTDDAETVDQLQITAFVTLLLPVFVPIFHKVYDALFVNFVKQCVRKKFSVVNLHFAHKFCL